MDPKYLESEGNQKTTNAMNLVRGKLHRLTPPALAAKAEYVEGKMSGNVNFPAPVPSIASITAARTALVIATKNAESKAPADIVVRRTAYFQLRDLLSALVRYVNSASAGDADKAVSSGFELSKKPEPVEKLNAPTHLSAEYGSYLGGVELRWEPVRHARMYQVYMTAGDPSLSTGWILLGVTGKARYSAAGLESGKFYNFRVTALGGVGEGPASENIGQRAA